MIAFDRLDAFIEQSRGAHSSERLAHAFARVTAEYGFTEFVACTLCDFRNLPSDAVWINRYNPDWTANYLEQRYFEIDPFFSGGQLQRRPFVWHEFIRDRSLTSRQKRLFQDAPGFGHGYGMTVPIHIWNNPSGCVSLTADRPFDFSARHTIHLLSVYFFEGARRLAQAKTYHHGQTEAPVPTPREAECLRWAALGKTTWEIGAILTISEATARYHLEGARRKYGAATTVQAVAKALLADDIRL